MRQYIDRPVFVSVFDCIILILLSPLWTLDAKHMIECDSGFSRAVMSSFVTKGAFHVKIDDDVQRSNMPAARPRSVVPRPLSDTIQYMRTGVIFTSDGQKGLYGAQSKWLYHNAVAQHHLPKVRRQDKWSRSSPRNQA